MLTAYDATIARLVDRGGVDMILVGDSAGHNHLGYDDTLSVTMDEAISNTAAVVRGTENALVIGDMPFGSYGASIEQSVDNAVRFLKTAGADAVKLETAPGGDTTIKLVTRFTELGIPVQGHLGLTPQHMNELGGAVIQGREGADSEYADRLVETAQRLADAGVFTLVVEATTEAVAKRVSESLAIPTIGIGAGRYTDGQVLVVNDVLGLGGEGYSLAKEYVKLDEIIENAIAEFVHDVREERFPTAANAYEPIDSE
jgi:3-methyl-2-oxobutanoate hydroxymethyltransferase